MTDAFKLVQISQARKKPSSAERTIPTQQEIDELFKERITPETDLPPMQPLFEMFGVPCFYRGELVADCGKAKSGKTFFLSIIMSACLSQKALALKRWGLTDSVNVLESLTDNTDSTDFSSQAKDLSHTDLTDSSLLRRDIGHTERTEITEMKPLRVLWIDTEQSQQSTQEILKDRIMPLAEKGLADSADSAEILKSHTERTEITEMPPSEEKSVGSERSVRKLNETFYAFNLRGLGYDRRQRMVEVAVRAIKPDIVILDGIKDLMTDINDAVQATIIMEKLMALAKEQNCCIVCVLHQNKSEQDRNMRGSIGTELTNKAFEVFQCEIIGENNGKTETFKVTHTYSRKQKMKQNFYYCINEEGLPEWLPDYQEQPRDGLGRWVSWKTQEESQDAMTEADLRKLFKTAMEGYKQRPYNVVMAVALKKCGITDAKAYYLLLEQAVALGIIHMGIHPDTHQTWLELDDGTLPF